MLATLDLNGRFMEINANRAIDMILIRFLVLFPLDFIAFMNKTKPMIIYKLT